MNSMQKFARVDHVFNTTSQTWIEKFTNRVQGNTFYNFEVEACPHNGSWVINVVSKRPETSNKELRNALMSFLATELAKG